VLAFPGDLGPSAVLRVILREVGCLGKRGLCTTLHIRCNSSHPRCYLTRTIEIQNRKGGEASCFRCGVCHTPVCGRRRSFSEGVWRISKGREEEASKGLGLFGKSPAALQRLLPYLLGDCQLRDRIRNCRRKGQPGRVNLIQKASWRAWASCRVWLLARMAGP